MIKEWYPSKKVSTPTTTVVGNVTDTYNATRAGLDLPAYRARMVAIAKAVRECTERGWKAGTVLFPKDYQDWVSYGGVTILGIARTPQEYGHAPWNEAAPRILRCKLNDKPASFIDCSIDWLSATQPTKQEIQC